MDHLRIAVVGGGIGGLFVSHALRAAGFEVAVYEQAPALGEIGAGVYLTPNGVRQLERLGFGAAVEKYGARVGAASRYYREDGSEIAPVQVTDSAGWNACFGMHRADFVRFLSETLPADVVHTGHRCTGFEQTEHSTRLHFENGVSVEQDLVIACDGIHSVLQKYAAPPSPPVFSKSVAYRGTVPADRVPGWNLDAWQMWLGKGRHFLVFPVRAASLINFVGFVPADAEMSESWSAAGDPDQLRREFAGWDPMVQRLLERVDHTFRSALYDREPLKTWTNGRLTLLGDAAHPMLPHLGQGANQSLEDGIALATILAERKDGDISAALHTYEELRRERVADVQRGARQNGLRYDSMLGDIAKRDAEIAAHASFRRALYDHDVVVAANAPALQLL